MKIPGKPIEFLVPGIAIEHMESGPPVHTTISVRNAHSDRIVQNGRHQDTDDHLRCEDHIEKVVELHISKSIINKLNIRQRRPCPVQN